MHTFTSLVPVQWPHTIYKLRGTRNIYLHPLISSENNMTPPHKMIASLPFHSKADVLLVRATRIWESINTKTGKLIHTNVVFVDEEVCVTN